MAYLSLYRKYRPQTFGQVMGQDHVVQTLQNALRYGHVVNGYLFCGTRGVAKTTIARILAKCLNCIGPDGALTSPQAEPCNECGPCRAIQAGQHVDIVEMDAASNRSVNDIARLRESVQFGPMEARYKVYIVDEAHQLSSDAKDAFLKTLEEPPANVIFILATTEAHAIPITIASRCQQFDFRRGSIQQIAEQCQRVLGAESVVMPAEAINLVAREAEGSYRDALSLLDQVLAYKREGITASDVASALGTVESEAIDQTLKSVAAGDQAALFSQADGLFLQGKDVRQFLRALGTRVRDLLFVRAGAASGGLLESGVEAPSLNALAQDFAPEALLRMLEIVADAERRTRQSDQHRLLLEMTLLNLAAAQSAPAPTDRIIAGSDRPPRTGAPASAPPRNGRPAAPVHTSVPAPHPAPSEPRVAHSEPAASTPQRDGVAATRQAPAPAQPAVADKTGVDRGASTVLSRVQSSWQEIINHVHVRSPGGVQVIKDAEPVAVEGNMITLRFNNKSNVEMLDNVKRRQLFETVINKVLQEPDGAYRIRPIHGAAPKPPAPAPAPAPEQRAEQVAFSEEQTPVLDEVIAVFGGRIIEGDDE